MNSKAKHIVSFLQEHIFSFFGPPLKIVSDNGGAFVSREVLGLFHKYNITFSTSSPYYPQGNELVVFTNKKLIKIIKHIKLVTILVSSKCN